jgi:DNA-binding GntR family transcriptional regulator
MLATDSILYIILPMKASLSSLVRPAPLAIADALRGAILAGALPAGTQIRQEHVAAEYGVSHIPVREALRRLEAEGLVTIHPNRGAFVSRLDAADARDIGDMRTALETLAVRLSVPVARAADLAAAAEALAAGDRSMELSEWSDANWAFHRALYAPCRRPCLIAAIETLWRNVERYLRVIWQAADYQDKSQDEHRRILDAYRRGEAAEAALLVAAHVDEAMRVLGEFLGATR